MGTTTMWTLHLPALVMVALHVATIIPVNAESNLGPTANFHELVAEYWQWRLADAPEFATLFGEDKYANRVEDYSLSVLETRRVAIDGFRYRLQSIAESMLGGVDRVSYAVLNDTLTTYLDGYKWRHYGPANPINFLEGAWTDPETEGQLENIRTESDLVAFIERIHGWQHEAQNYIDRLQKAVQVMTTNNWVSDEVYMIFTDPRKVMFTSAFGVGEHHFSQAEAVNQLNSMTSTPPTEFAWYKPFNDTLQNLTIPDSNKTRLRQQAEEAIKMYLSSFENVTGFLNNEYKSHARQSLGVNSLPEGAAYYQACLKWHLSVDMTPEEVHSKGLQEVDRIYREMKTVMERLGFNGTIVEFFTMLKNDSRFIIDDPEEAINRFRSIIKDRIQPKLSKYFKNIPNNPVIVERMPYDGPGGTYASGSPDGSRPGVFQVNVMRPQDNPTYDMVALALHETDPGHHLQDVFAQASKDMPMFRRFFDDNKYYAVPYHFPFYTANVEGWALYAESLGEQNELGIYRDDYELMGRYASEMFRACRLVVDTGLHHYNWSRDEAIEYMVNYTSGSRQSLGIEIDRYITWPGQACSYKIGELKIKELRSLAESALGDAFDIRDFHALILDNGAMPLAVMEYLVHAWINEQKTGVNAEDFITLSCDETNWNIRIDLGRLHLHDPHARAADIYLGDNSCTGVTRGGQLTFRYGLRECVTSEKISGETFIYNNELMYAIHDPVRPYVIQRFKWRVGVECNVSRHASPSSHFHLDTHNNTGNLVTTSTGYNVSMAFYSDPNYRQALPGNPLYVALGAEVYVKVYTAVHAWSTKMRVHTCYTMTSPAGTGLRSSVSYLIKDGCEVDGNTHIISQSSHETRFVFQYFEYASNQEFDVMCDVTFCNNHDYSRKCSQTCQPVQLVG